MLVGYYGISTLGGYLMPNPILYIFMYIKFIWFGLFGYHGVIYSYADSCRKNHNDMIIKTSEDFFKKIYLSFYL